MSGVCHPGCWCRVWGNQHLGHSWKQGAYRNSHFGGLFIINACAICPPQAGNRRSANIRSVGYTDLFALHKDDLWDALNEYPEARRQLLEKGTAMLMKDNMIDEEKAKAEADAVVAMEAKLERMCEKMEDMTHALSYMIAEYTSFNIKMKKRVRMLEYKHNMVKEEQGKPEEEEKK